MGDGSPDFDDAVGVSEQVGEGSVEVHEPDNKPRDRVRERGAPAERILVDDHRVDVGEEPEDVARGFGERHRVCLEDERRIAAAPRNEGKSFDRVNVLDEEEDVGEVDGLKTEGRTWLIDFLDLR